VPLSSTGPTLPAPPMPPGAWMPQSQPSPPKSTRKRGWNPEAVSRVGAVGMAQFMPATARWWCEANGLGVAECQPTNPTWAMRALVGYDRWLFDRVRGPSEFDRLWAALRAYNGGLGHWQQEAATVRPALDRQAVDSACGKARRHPSFCPENLGYPRRILTLLQPRYLAWGRGVSPKGTSFGAHPKGTSFGASA